MELERKTIGIVSKQANLLIERRRQDVRDQAKEISESGSKYKYYICENICTYFTYLYLYYFLLYILRNNKYT